MKCPLNQAICLKTLNYFKTQGIATIKILLIITIFQGCSSFSLPQKPFPPEIAHTVERLIPAFSYHIKTEESISSLGHQYLLFFPFRTILLEDTQGAIEREANMAGALLGVRLVKSASNPDLILKVKELDLTAYDLFFTRKIVASVSIEATVLSSPVTGDLYRPVEEQTQTFITSRSDYVKYAFSEPLLAVFEATLREALQKAIIWYGGLRRPSLR